MFLRYYKIENITNGNIGQSILKHAAESASDVSDNIIPENSEKVNTYKHFSKSLSYDRTTTICP